jgi:hypothetical protein
MLQKLTGTHTQRLPDDKDNIIQAHLLPRDKLGNVMVLKAGITFLVQGGFFLVSLYFYLRLHGIEIVSLLSGTSLQSLATFGFIGNEVTVGSMIEVLFGATMATTLRWMNVEVIASRRKEFNPLRHIIDWCTDLMSTPMLAAVIIYALKSLRLTFGQNIDLSLSSASVGVFMVLGFLLGYFGQAPRGILVSIWERTLGQYSASRHPEPEEDDKHDKKPSS